jgi:ethanolamine utilization protein EutQ
MSQLICNADIENLHKKGKSVCHINCGAIITPAAKDLAKTYNISFQECCETDDCNSENCEPDCYNVSENAESSAILTDLRQLLAKQHVSVDDIHKVFKEWLEEDQQSADEKLFDACVHSNGLKVVNGQSVRMDDFNTGNKDANVHFQEAVGKEESKMSAGFLTIDRSSFDWKLSDEEIDYVIEGNLCIMIDGKKYCAKAGDVVFVPANSQVTWSSPDKAKIFCTTYPSNWADLI